MNELKDSNIRRIAAKAIPARAKVMDIVVNKVTPERAR
jgi:hypothetical protein